MENLASILQGRRPWSPQRRSCALLRRALALDQAPGPGALRVPRIHRLNVSPFVYTMILNEAHLTDKGRETMKRILTV